MNKHQVRIEVSTVVTQHIEFKAMALNMYQVALKVEVVAAWHDRLKAVVAEILHFEYKATVTVMGTFPVRLKALARDMQKYGLKKVIDSRKDHHE